MGGLTGNRAWKGVFITTSRFSKEALEYIHRIEQRVVLIDGETLAQFMIEHNVGVSEESRYIVKKIDMDYFEEWLVSSIYTLQKTPSLVIYMPSILRFKP